MRAFRAAPSSPPSTDSNILTAARRVSSRGLRFDTSRPTPSIVVVSVRGDVDALTADELAGYVLQARSPGHDVILDLRGVDFFGTAGFSVIEGINERSGGPTRLAVVPSRAVARVLQLCTTKRALLVAVDVDSALTTLQGHPNQRTLAAAASPRRLRGI